MDQTVQISEDTSIVNGMNCACYDSPIDIEIIRSSMKRHFKTKPKFLYKFVEILGDYYYKEMSEDKVFELCITEMNGVVKNSDDINHFIQDNINIKMPIDGPLWRIWFQNYEEDGQQRSVLFWKNHHSFCDGVSIMLFNLALSEEYGRDYFVKGKDMTLFQQIAIKLMVPF